MFSVLARRLLLAIPTLLGVLVVVFLLLYVAPGDPVQEMVGERADAATIARLRARAPPRRAAPDAVRALRRRHSPGDLGRSFITNRPIARDVAERFPKTLLLAGAAMLLASVTGITIGVLSARRPGGWVDRLALGGAYLGISFPVYWVGLLLVLLFARDAPLAPAERLRRREVPDPAGARARHALGRVPRPRHPLGDARGAGRRFRAHGAREGTRRARRRAAPRAAQRAHPGHHGARPRLRLLPHGQHPHRDDLLVAGTRPLRRERDQRGATCRRSRGRCCS